ncbi:MAG: glycosyltransferase [Syntrophales bacterium]|jgi:3-deoxy-D-manno-octulosonic-acid transferase|nr:glycosyltransferase [Syntrophales bacterium]MDD4338577.1 glycosyltransferase N-terminal domain-containing protein [Syntrophales bacterium]HOG06607.1 glycosyltransferase N-terminal domain-containing protein [Syntrophales bacterium]HOS76639.1 glycosyltransferase N-terminal domain-containing protein [Syntrophales bacterium]HPB71219.1 glycosyltransferase N-terminal domain-containing protein [Syntrophales bacterium]
MLYHLYNLVLVLAAVFAVPYYGAKILFQGKYRRSIGPKFGLIRPDLFARMEGTPRIWMHAVSVGEVTAAAPIIASLREHFPAACIVLSTSTETGQEMARRIATAATVSIYYPLDLGCVVRRVIDRVRPDLFIPVETELWPNFLRHCKDRGVRVVMVNGRISPRSFRRFVLTRFFWREVLAAVDEMGVISQADAERVEAMGVPAKKIHVLGNAKYDSLAAKASPKIREDIARRLGLTEPEPVFVAGSTHEGEEAIVLDVYRRLLEVVPAAQLILIPRHVERAAAVLTLVREAGFPDCITMSELNKGKKRAGERVIVIDVIGELFKVYSLATAVFCGGSLVQKGGQNILEAAAWGKVVFYGRFMDDFREERALLEETGAGITVRDGADLAARLIEMIRHPEERRRLGEKGRDRVIANMGAAGRYAAMIRMQVKKTGTAGPKTKG